jgi:ribosomal protein L37E
LSDEVTYQYEYWDCNACGNKAVRGDKMECPNCGKPRGEGVRFYTKDAAEQVTDTEQIKLAEAGEDWECSSCKSYNSATRSSCHRCGSPRESDDRDYFAIPAKKGPVDQAKVVSGPADMPGLSRTGTRHAGDGYQRPYRASDSPFLHAPILAKIAAAACALALVGFGVWYFGAKEFAEFEVVGKTWQRSVSMKRSVEKTLQDWEGELEGVVMQTTDRDRRVHHTEQQVHHYRTDTWVEQERYLAGHKTETYRDSERYRSGSKQVCSSSYQSLGNGKGKTTRSCRSEPTYSTRYVTKTRSVPDYKHRPVTRSKQVPVYISVPIYRDWVTYRTLVWDNLPDVTVFGSNSEPEWPAPQILVGAGGRPDQQVGRSEAYSFKARRIGKDEDFPAETDVKVDLDTFRSLKVGGQVKLSKSWNVIQLVKDEEK